MSLYRRAAKVDATQNAIVRSLRDHGIKVWSIRQPCDLLLRFWCNRHQSFCWQTLEVKTPTGKQRLTVRKRADQKRQQEFIDSTQTPVAISLEDAIRKINALHRLGGIEVSCVLKTIPATV